LNGPAKASVVLHKQGCQVLDAKVGVMRFWSAIGGLPMTLIRIKADNRIRTTGKCPSNLHSAWDTCLVRNAVGDDAAAAASELLSSIMPSQAKACIRASAKAKDSFAIARSDTTYYCVSTSASCQPTGSPVMIDDSYIAANVSIVREQLAKAGIRLAHMSDQALTASSH
jgi:hypothetical protein